MQCAWVYRSRLDFELLRLALGFILPRYPHLAGRLFTWNSRKHVSGDPAAFAEYRPRHGVALSNAGVPLDEAAVHGVSASDFSYDNQRIVRSLAAGKDIQIPIDGDVVCRAQYAEFVDGSGSALSVTTIHSLVDGHVYFTFVSAWAAMYRHLRNAGPALPDARLLAPLPVYRPSLMVFPHACSGRASDVSPSGALAVMSVWRGIKFVWSALPLLSDRYLAVHFSRAHIAAMKQAASIGLADGEFVSTNDVIAAQLWRVFCLVRRLAAAETTRFTFFVNLRGRHASLPANYATAAFSVFSAVATVAQVTAMPFADVVGRVHHAVQAVRDQIIEDELGWIAHRQSTLGLTEAIMPRLNLATDFAISSWTAFDVFGADFGGDGCANTFFVPMLAGIAVGATLFLAPPMLGDGVAALLCLTSDQFTQLLTEEWQQRIHQP